MQATGKVGMAGLTPGARRVLDAASTLFYQHGIHAVGVEAIAAEAGVTKSTLYDRFESKDNLVVAYLHQRHESWWARLEQRIADAEHPRVLAMFDAYAEELLPAQRGCAFLNAAGELPADHPAFAVIREHKRSVKTRLLTLLNAELPEIENAEALAEHLFLLLEGAVAHRGIEGSPPSLAKQARRIAQELLTQHAGKVL